MKTVYSLISVGIFVFFSAGCNSSTNSQNVLKAKLNPVAPLSLSTHYKSDAVACYDYNSHVFKTSASLTSGQEDIVINGDVLTSTTTSNNCTVKITAQIHFNMDGTLNIINRVITEATNNECELSFNLASTPSQSIIPTSIAAIYKAGETLPDIINNYYAQTGQDIAFYSYFYRNTKNLEDACLVVYKLQL